MTDRDLDALLRSAPIPEPGPEYWRDFASRLELSRDAAAPGPALALRESASTWWGGRWKLAFICLVMGLLFVMVQRRQLATHGSLSVSAAQTLIREVAGLFPDRLQSVIVDNGETHLVLANAGRMDLGQPLVVRLWSGARCRTILTFSGQTVEVGNRPFEALADSHGGVLLSGKNAVWSSHEPRARLAGVRVEAMMLNDTL